MLSESSRTMTTAFSSTRESGSHAMRAVGRAAGNAGGDAENVSITIVVRRKTGEEETLTVVAPLDDRPQIGIHPFSGNVVKRRADGSAAALWLETGDKVLSINGEAVQDFRSFRERADSARPVKTIGIERAKKRMTLEPDTVFTERDLAEAGAGEGDIESTRVSPRVDLPAGRAGVSAGDRIVRVGSTKVTKWSELQAAIVANGRKPVSITLERDGKTLDLTIQPGATVARPLLGYEFSQARTLQKEENFLAAVSMGWTRTKLAMKSVALTIRSLVTRRVSARHIGGPITLARVTYDMFDAGLGRYLYILALISINLAILNILPIPVLDGGQIVLLCAEKLRGKPLPEKVVGYFQMVGLLLILSLLVLAFKNDIAMLLQ